MKMKAGLIALVFATNGIALTAVANPNEGITEVELEQIKLSCKAEAKDAVTPEWYEQECISDSIQALKEQKGIAQPVKEES
ncbi:MAG: hypothetical protein OEZ39_17830 [Gammaproteobacteria bacterium]|nr:hypothetical protein [Gammaproteobacteria bacterium]MDH5653726.1 hypothetical protein [Gammaproteobacteria bacterium]